MKTQNSKFNTFRTLVLFVFAMISIAGCTSEGKSEKGEEIKPPKTTIHEAAFYGDADEMRLHIAAGSDLDAKDPYGSTPLVIAATFNKPAVAKLLIEGGANVNATSADGSTPLHIAAFYCRKEIVEMLLAAGVDKNVRNNYGSTALESVATSFEDVKPIYDQVSKDLGPLGFKLDYDYVQETRPVIAEMIQNAN